MDQCDTKIDLVKYMWVSDLYFMVHCFALYLVIHLNYFYILRIGAGRGYSCPSGHLLQFFCMQLCFDAIHLKTERIHTFQLRFRHIISQKVQILFCVDSITDLMSFSFSFYHISMIWATSWPSQQNGMCAQQRLISAWASVQSDQSLHCALSGLLRKQAFFMRTAKTLIRLGGCPDWSESLPDAQATLLSWSGGGSVLLLCHFCMQLLNFASRHVWISW